MSRGHHLAICSASIRPSARRRMGTAICGAKERFAALSAYSYSEKGAFMIQTFLVAARDRARLAQLFSVVARFGLTGLLNRIGIPQKGQNLETANLPERVRLALEELGPTYIKFGQILATRRDILTDEWAEALEKLQSGAPTLPYESLRADVELALGEPVEQAFLEFDRTPLAAASIAQVHRATLKDGRKVVVKIRRPGIRQQMEADLRLLRHMAALVEANNEEARRIKPHALIDQLARDILDELDFTREGRNADMLRADYANDARIVIPQIHWEWTSENLLVMDYIEGIPPRNPDLLRAAGLNPSIIAETGAELVLYMVLIHGRFHGDPHPGNLLCLSGNRIALLDLGSVGTVSTRRQHEFLTFIVGIQSGSAVAVTDMFMQWSMDQNLSRERILAASEQLIARHSGEPLVLSDMVADMFRLLRQEALALPPDLLLVFKSLLTIDGVLSRIEPDFDLSKTLESLRRKLLFSRLSGIQEQGLRSDFLLELLRLGEDAPHLIRKASQWMDRQVKPPPPPQIIDDKGIKRALWLVSAAIIFSAILNAGIIL